MKILPIFIIWAIVFFLLPKLMGSKKRPAQEKLPNGQQQVPGSAKDDVTNTDFWRNWGIEEPPMESESMVSENVQLQPIPSAVLKHDRRVAPVENVASPAWEGKPNAWQGKISKKAIRRGLIMKEVLGAPRALNPYGKDV